MLCLVCSVAVLQPQAAGANSKFGSYAAAPAMTADAEPSHRVLQLERIVVDGNSHISDSEIVGTLGLDPSDTVNVAILEEARRRLLSEYPLLSSADFSTRPGSGRGLVILDISIVERKSVIFETGYGLHDNASNLVAHFIKRLPHLINIVIV